LVLTPSQAARRERRRKNRQDKKVEDVVEVNSQDSDYLEELAKLKAKKRRESGGVKEEPKDSP
jgi:hypothetical protein